jgi:hypothetical protein
MKVSFDFDGTLSRKDVQKFASKLVKSGFEVWIVTSRCATESALAKGWWWVEKQNQQLYDVAEECGISRERIQFTEHVDKIEFLEGKNFVFHLDDDMDELIEIKKSGDPCGPINVGHNDWEIFCIEELEKKFSVVLNLTEDDSSGLLKELLDPREPSAKLKEAFKKYKNEI